MSQSPVPTGAICFDTGSGYFRRFDGRTWEPLVTRAQLRRRERDDRRNPGDPAAREAAWEDYVAAHPDAVRPKLLWP